MHQPIAPRASQVVQALATKAAHVPTRVEARRPRPVPARARASRASCASRPPRPLLGDVQLARPRSGRCAERSPRAAAPRHPRLADARSPARLPLAVPCRGPPPGVLPELAVAPPGQADESAALQASTVQLLLAQRERGAERDAATPPPPPARPPRHAQERKRADGGGRSRCRRRWAAAPAEPDEGSSALDDVLDPAVDVALSSPPRSPTRSAAARARRPRGARGGARARARIRWHEGRAARPRRSAPRSSAASSAGLEVARYLLALRRGRRVAGHAAERVKGLARRDDAAAVATPSPPKSRQHKEREWRQKSCS